MGAHLRISGDTASSPTPPGCSTGRIGGGAGFATRQVALELRLCHRAKGKGSEYPSVRWAAVRCESLRRRQFALIGPPAPVQFYKLPGLFHLAFRHSGAAPFSHVV